MNKTGFKVKLVALGLLVTPNITVVAAELALPKIPLVGVSVQREYRGVLGEKGANYEPGTIAGQFNVNTIFLAEQLHTNADPDARAKAIVATSITELDNLGGSSTLGRLLSEHVAHHLKIRGWTIADARMTKELTINGDGEFILSRDASRLNPNISAGTVLTGTYAATPDGVLVNLRIVDFVSGLVVSSAQTRIPLDRFTAAIIKDPKKSTSTIAITK